MIGSIRKYTCIPTQSWERRDEAELVTVIVPCRNEAHNLPIIVPSLLAQDYPQLEFIFLDDRSTDRTFEMLLDYQRKDSRIQILKGKPLPTGWTGKNHAMFQCAQAAKGKWLLFTDADTFHEKHSVSSSIRYSQKRKLDLLTMSARCVCKTFGEHLVQPMGIGCFSVWFKLEDVNNPESSTPLACGQYLMIRREVYDAVGGSEGVKSEVVEDLALFKNIKGAGYRCELSIGTHLFATRMYRSFKESWVGWRRIYLHALEKNVPSILRKISMLLCFSFLPFFIFSIAAWWTVQGSGGAQGILMFSGTLCAFILFLRSRSNHALQASQWSILLHPVSALTITAILIDCLKYHTTGQKVEWKMERY